MAVALVHIEVHGPLPKKDRYTPGSFRTTGITLATPNTPSGSSRKRSPTTSPVSYTTSGSYATASGRWVGEGAVMWCQQAGLDCLDQARSRSSAALCSCRSRAAAIADANTRRKYPRSARPIHGTRGPAADSECRQRMKRGRSSMPILDERSDVPQPSLWELIDVCR